MRKQRKKVNFFFGPPNGGRKPSKTIDLAQIGGCPPKILPPHFSTMIENTAVQLVALMADQWVDPSVVSLVARSVVQLAVWTADLSVVLLAVYLAVYSVAQLVVRKAVQSVAVLADVSAVLLAVP